MPSLQGFLRWIGRGRHRGQARPRREPARRSAHHDRARRQGAGGAGRVPAGHDAVPEQPGRGCSGATRTGCRSGAARGESADAAIAPARRPAPAPAAGIPAPALCRDDPGAGPALCLRLEERSGGAGGAVLARAVRGRLDGIAGGVPFRHPRCSAGARAGAARRCASAARRPRRRAAMNGARGAAPVGAAAGLGVAPPPPEPSPRTADAVAAERPGAGDPVAAGNAGPRPLQARLLVHRLLQSLPELPAAARGGGAGVSGAAGARARRASSRRVCAEVIAVLDRPAPRRIVGAGSRAEVPVVGLIPGETGTEQALCGQIDRLAVTASRVLIVDFKTVRPPPASEAGGGAGLPAAARDLPRGARRIYRDRRIDCAFLWTDGPRLMPISPALLVRHLPGRLPRQGAAGGRPGNPKGCLGVNQGRSLFPNEGRVQGAVGRALPVDRVVLLLVGFFATGPCPKKTTTSSAMSCSSWGGRSTFMTTWSRARRRPAMAAPTGMRGRRRRLPERGLAFYGPAANKPRHGRA